MQQVNTLYPTYVKWLPNNDLIKIINQVWMERLVDPSIH